MTDAERTREEGKQVLVQAALLVASALSVGAFLAVCFIISGCLPPTTAAEPLPPFRTVAGETPYSTHWRLACACRGVDGAAEPEVRIMEPDRWNAQGDEGFPCAVEPVTGCTGTIEGGEVRVGPRLLALMHEFSHAAAWYADGDFGADVDGGCYGVAR